MTAKKGIPILISLDAQTNADGDKEDVMRLITTGELIETQQETVIRYEETLDEKEPPQKIELRIGHDSVIMSRKGAFNANMVFIKGHRYESQYHTPYGVLDMALFCTKADYTSDKDGGELQLQYQLDLSGQFAAMHDMKLHWMRKKGQV